MMKKLFVILAVVLMVVAFGSVANSNPNPLNANSPPGHNDVLTKPMYQADQNSNSPPAQEMNVLVANTDLSNAMVSNSPPASVPNETMAVNTVLSDVKFVSASPPTPITDGSMAVYAMLIDDMRQSDESPPNTAQIMSVSASTMTKTLAEKEVRYAYIGNVGGAEQSAQFSFVGQNFDGIIKTMSMNGGSGDASG